MVRTRQVFRRNPVSLFYAIGSTFVNSNVGGIFKECSTTIFPSFKPTLHHWNRDCAEVFQKHFYNRSSKKFQKIHIFEYLIDTVAVATKNDAPLRWSLSKQLLCVLRIRRQPYVRFLTTSDWKFRHRKLSLRDDPVIVDQSHISSRTCYKLPEDFNNSPWWICLLVILLVDDVRKKW